jgi:hypothetical protein
MNLYLAAVARRGNVGGVMSARADHTGNEKTKMRDT